MSHIENLTAQFGDPVPIRHALDQVVEAPDERIAELAAEGPEWVPAPLTSVPGRGALEGPEMQTAPAANGSRSRIPGLDRPGGVSITPGQTTINPEGEGEGPCLES